MPHQSIVSFPYGTDKVATFSLSSQHGNPLFSFADWFKGVGTSLYSSPSFFSLYRFLSHIFHYSILFQRSSCSVCWSLWAPWWALLVLLQRRQQTAQLPSCKSNRPILLIFWSDFCSCNLTGSINVCKMKIITWKDARIKVNVCKFGFDQSDCKMKTNKYHRINIDYACLCKVCIIPQQGEKLAA